MGAPSEPGIDQELRRIADALERLAPPLPPLPSWEAAAYVWHAGKASSPAFFQPVASVHALPLDLLKGIAMQKERLLANVERFALGHAANHALLWGARGTGKSSLVASIHRHLRDAGTAMVLIEIAREDVASLGELLAVLAGESRRFLLLCDDLSFDAGDDAYKSLKSLLDGGVAGSPPNVLLCATSNRRHLMPREMAENDRNAAIHPGETIDEKVSLSDRFGLWLGFHALPQPVYLEIVEGYLAHFSIGTEANWQAEALTWAAGRGARSGRVAWQYFVDLASRRGVRVVAGE